MARQQLPPKLAAEAPTHKACPDCFAEHRDPYVLPISQFYVRRVKNGRYKGGLRLSAYCIEHENKRSAARGEARRRKWLEEERRTGVTPPQLAKLRERSLRKNRPMTAAQKAAASAAAKAKYAADPEKYKQANRDYLAKPEKAAARKKYAAEWYQRRGKILERERRDGRHAPLALGKSVRRRREAAATAAVPQEETDTR